MRRLLFLFALVPFLAWAQAPQKIAYQGRLLQPNGTAESGVKDLVFSIFAADKGGVALWSETQSLALNDGYYSTYLGEVNSIKPGTFDGSERYLEISVGTDPLAPRQKVTSVPYAVTCIDARNVSGGTVSATSIDVGNALTANSGGAVKVSALVVGTATVIDSNGNWVGSPTGLQGPKGDIGPKGDTGLPGPASERAWLNSLTTACAIAYSASGGAPLAVLGVSAYQNGTDLCASVKSVLTGWALNTPYKGLCAGKMYEYNSGAGSSSAVFNGLLMGFGSCSKSPSAEGYSWATSTSAGQVACCF